MPLLINKQIINHNYFETLTGINITSSGALQSCCYTVPGKQRRFI